MSFSAQWLKLREPYDLAARNADVLAAVGAHFAGRPSLGIVDLACGTGASLRALAPLLPPRQDWRLADNDLGLLAVAQAHPRPAVAKIIPMAVDLARDLEAALDGPLHLVTTSALLDLVSADWLERLAVEVAARRLPVYAALSYDGRVAFAPADGEDAGVIAAVNADQRGNKGFGLALGPAAADAAIERFTNLGYHVVQGRADWVFGPDDRAIQDQIVNGWAEIAGGKKRQNQPKIESWLLARRKLIAAGRSAIRVGHVDFFATPIR